ncbi:hypothetical protein [Cyclobacterium plantarum]|uniref:hypothetical protein n=1 Tax=Cyclobacterium plantarum TaxID=2716263 RepID=UPI003F6F3FEE
MVIQRDETFFVYLPAGPEKGCEKVGKALEFVVQGHTVMGSMERRKIQAVNGADKAIMTFLRAKTITVSEDILLFTTLYTYIFLGPVHKPGRVKFYAELFCVRIR